MNNPSTKSHVVPAMLLAQFAVPRINARDPDDIKTREIVAYCKNQPAQKRSISTCYEKKFYRYANDDGSSNDELEPWMGQEIEGPFNELLPSFDGPFHFQSHNQFRIITRYVANIFSRSHQRRVASHLQQQRVADIVMELANDPKLLRQLCAAFSWAANGKVSVDRMRQIIIDANMRDSDEAKKSHYLRNVRMYEEDIVRMLANKPYGLLRAPESERFILGDTVLVTRQPIGNTLAVGVGFAVQDMHVLLPISPKTCIQIGIPDRQEHVLMPEEVRSINVDQIKLMHRYVYSQIYSGEIQQGVDTIGGTLTYILNTFIIPPFTAQSLLDHFIGDLFEGKSLYEEG